VNPVLEKISQNPIVKLGAKLAEWSAIILAFQFWFKPSTVLLIDEKMDAYHTNLSAKSKAKKSLRLLISEETGWKEDRVHIKIGELVHAFHKLQVEFNAFVPMLENEQKWTEPRLIVIDDEEWWYAENRKLYRVTRNAESGKGFYWYKNQWKPIFE
jgi:hypothetical protein